MYDCVQVGDSVYKKVNNTFSVIGGVDVQYTGPITILSLHIPYVIAVGSSLDNAIAYVPDGYETE